jgi:hypothetical protein
MREDTDLLVESFHLTEQEPEELISSGQERLYSYRVARAKPNNLIAKGLRKLGQSDTNNLLNPSASLYPARAAR